MARLPRLTLPGQVHHILQRGAQGAPLFLDQEDHEWALQHLQSVAAQARVQVHAYVLLPTSIELLATPRDETGVSHLMQAFGRAYVPRFNRKHAHSGTLWAGRYRSGVLQADRYLLDCMALMDQRPVSAGLASEPVQYRWSSHAHYTGHRPDRLITPHPQYWMLGDTPFAREAAYAQRVRQGVAPATSAALEHTSQAGWVLGDAAFMQALQRQTDRRLQPGRAGRPRKNDMSPIK